MILKYADWLGTVPAEINNDPIWEHEVYRLALFADDLGWEDTLKLSEAKLMFSVADQLHRSLGSISANLAEGYSRSKGLERARCFEIALGSARASRDWYYKSRHVLSPDVVKHRMGLITHIIAMLAPMISLQRHHAIREERAEYSALDFSLAGEVPIP